MRRLTHTQRKPDKGIFDVFLLLFLWLVCQWGFDVEITTVFKAALCTPSVRLNAILSRPAGRSAKLRNRGISVMSQDKRQQVQRKLLFIAVALFDCIMPKSWLDGDIFKSLFSGRRKAAFC